MISLAISTLYIPIFALMLIVITFRVGSYRIKNKINLGDGGSDEMVRLIRGQGNFVELVPISLLLIVLVEASGASAGLVHGLYIALLVGRVSHYIQISGLVKPLIFRPVGMVLTFSTLLVGSIVLLMEAF